MQTSVKTDDPAVGSDNWSFYFNPQQQPWKPSFDWGYPESGGYVLLNEELIVKGIRPSRVREWYFTREVQYLGTDILIKAEELDTFQK